MRRFRSLTLLLACGSLLLATTVTEAQQAGGSAIRGPGHRPATRDPLLAPGVDGLRPSSARRCRSPRTTCTVGVGIKVLAYDLNPALRVDTSRTGALTRCDLRGLASRLGLSPFRNNVWIRKNIGKSAYDDLNLSATPMGFRRRQQSSGPRGAPSRSELVTHMLALT